MHRQHVVFAFLFYFITASNFPVHLLGENRSIPYSEGYIRRVLETDANIIHILTKRSRVSVNSFAVFDAVR